MAPVRGPSVTPNALRARLSGCTGGRLSGRLLARGAGPERAESDAADAARLVAARMRLARWRQHLPRRIQPLARRRLRAGARGARLAWGSLRLPRRRLRLAGRGAGGADAVALAVPVPVAVLLATTVALARLSGTGCALVGAIAGARALAVSSFFKRAG